MATMLTPGEMLRRRATEATLAQATREPKWDPVAALLAPSAAGAPVVFCELPSRLLGGYRAQDDAIVLNARGFGVGPDDLWAEDGEQARTYAALEGILRRASLARSLAAGGALVPEAADHVAAAILDASGAQGGDEAAQEALRRAGLSDLRALAGRTTSLRSIGLLGANAAIRWSAGLLSEAEATPMVELAFALLPKDASEQYRRLVAAGINEGASSAARVSAAFQALAAAHDRQLGDDERPAFHAAYQSLVQALQNAEPMGDALLARYGAIVKKLVDAGVAHGIPALRALLFGADLGPVGLGVEQSHFASDDQGDQWVVKGHGGRGDLCFTEALCSLLAQALGILTPTAGAMRCDGEILFASRRVDIAHPQGKEKLSKRDAAGIAVLDALIVNGDRHDGNIVIESQGPEYRIWAIDHGHALPGLLSAVCGGSDHFVESPMKVATSVCGVPVDKAESDRFLRRISNLPEEHVRAMVRRMPAEWRKRVPAVALNQIPARIKTRAAHLIANRN